MNQRSGWRSVSCAILAAAFAAAAGPAPAARAAQRAPEAAVAEHVLKQAGAAGGLVVHVGCGDGRLTSALRAGPSYIVQGLDRDPEQVAAARRRLARLGLAGPVSVDVWSGSRLPYIDNVVNVLVVEPGHGLKEHELLRVLAPGGAALVRQQDGWRRLEKAWPPDVDQWTHFLHDPSNNAVAADARVGPPRGIQWLAGPDWIRSHHTLASVSGVVSAGGRVFFVADEGSCAAIDAPSRWTLTARDAFNGALLWKRRLASWAWHLQRFRSGPVQLPRTLVAAGGRVYAPLGLGAPISILDAADGRTLAVCEATEGAEEVIVEGDTVLVVTGGPSPEQALGDPARRGAGVFPNQKRLVAADAATGRRRWTRPLDQDGLLTPVTLAARDGRVFYLTDRGVICLRLADGQLAWRAERPAQTPRAEAGGRSGKRQPRAARGPGWAVATLVAADQLVLTADQGRLAAYDARDGRRLWEAPGPRSGFRSAVDLLVIDGVVWIGPDFVEARQARTGAVVRSTHLVQLLRTAGHHHRCYREKATTRFLLSGYRGIELFDLRGDEHSRNNWVRGLCQYGIMPANGLLYAPPHACGCYMEAELYGFWALAPASREPDVSDEPERLVQGPAYGEPLEDAGGAASAPGDWAAYRHDGARSGATPVAPPSTWSLAWRTQLGGRASPPVAAGELVVAALGDAHQVVALEAASGDARWTYHAGGRIQAPPTLHRGLVLFGAADGWVYALRQADGRLAWRFRAAPGPERTVAHDQVESLWPVRGVLVQNDLAYCAAGRSSYLDGGLWLYALDPASGRVRHRGRERSEPAGLMADRSSEIPGQKIDQNQTDFKTFLAPDRADAFSMDGARNDVLVGDGRRVFLRQRAYGENLDPAEQTACHLFSTSSLLDDAENHRSHWVLGVGDFRRLDVAYSWIANRPGGRKDAYLARPYGLLLAFNDQTVWGVRRMGSGQYVLFRQERAATPDGGRPDFQRISQRKPPFWTWSQPLPLRPRALVLAGGVVLAAGMPLSDAADRWRVFEGQGPGLLCAFSAADGSLLARQPLPRPPVWDGLAVTEDGVFVSDVGGGLSRWVQSR